MAPHCASYVHLALFNLSLQKSQSDAIYFFKVLLLIIANTKMYSF